MKFEDRYFNRFDFSKEEIKRNYENAKKDLEIAKIDKILDVKFNYAYSAFLKSGISLLSHYQIKIKSVPGHHVKIIEKMAEILNNNTINDVGNAMRSKRNVGMYAGGIDVTEKECREYINFVESVFLQVKSVLGF